MKLRIREATEKGYVEIEPGMVFDASYPDSGTRRGRLQGGGEICPTLMSGNAEIYLYEGYVETNSDRQHLEPFLRDELRRERLGQGCDSQCPNDDDRGGARADDLGNL